MPPSLPNSLPRADVPPFETSPLLADTRAAHGFFGRRGGVSRPPYDSLNTGYGGTDARDAVDENRRRCTAALGIPSAHLVTLRQRHTSRVVATATPWADDDAPEADGVVTTTRGLAIGALAADCMPALFLDADAGVIGAAHAGWRGALAGVLENTVGEMVKLGADPARMVVAFGPCLRPPDFEVGLDLVRAFTDRHHAAGRYFSAGDGPTKRQFDMVAFGRWRLAAVGVRRVELVGGSTLGAPDTYFSHRHAGRAGLADFGRNLSAICLL